MKELWRQAASLHPTRHPTRRRCCCLPPPTPACPHPVRVPVLGGEGGGARPHRLPVGGYRQQREVQPVSAARCRTAGAPPHLRPGCTLLLAWAPRRVVAAAFRPLCSFYTVSATCPVEDAAQYGPVLKQIVDSFVPPPLPSA